VRRCKLNSVLTHSLKATGYKPLPLNINPGFKMCLSNSTCAATQWMESREQLEKAGVDAVGPLYKL
jgi:hypothetical protein